LNRFKPHLETSLIPPRDMLENPDTEPLWNPLDQEGYSAPRVSWDSLVFFILFRNCSMMSADLDLPNVLNCTDFSCESKSLLSFLLILKGRLRHSFLQIRFLCLSQALLQMKLHLFGLGHILKQFPAICWLEWLE